MTRTIQITRAEVDELIEEEFGVNADYVSELLAQFERSPGSLDPEWREFFEELLNRAEAAALAGDGKPASEPALSRREAGTPATLEPGYDWSSSARPDSSGSARSSSSASARSSWTIPSEPEKEA